MALTSSNTYKDIIDTLNQCVGINAKPQLVSALTNKGATGISVSDSMASLVDKINTIPLYKPTDEIDPSKIMPIVTGTKGYYALCCSPNLQYMYLVNAQTSSSTQIVSKVSGTNFDIIWTKNFSNDNIFGSKVHVFNNGNFAYTNNGYYTNSANFEVRDLNGNLIGGPGDASVNIVGSCSNYVAIVDTSDAGYRELQIYNSSVVKIYHIAYGSIMTFFDFSEDGNYFYGMISNGQISKVKISDGSVVATCTYDGNFSTGLVTNGYLYVWYWNNMSSSTVNYMCVYDSNLNLITKITDTNFLNTLTSGSIKESIIRCNNNFNETWIISNTNNRIKPIKAYKSDTLEYVRDIHVFDVLMDQYDKYPINLYNSEDSVTLYSDDENYYGSFGRVTKSGKYKILE